jgi:hypothetical protein
MPPKRSVQRRREAGVTEVTIRTGNVKEADEDWGAVQQVTLSSTNIGPESSAPWPLPLILHMTWGRI